MEITNELLLLIKQCMVLLPVFEELVAAFRSNLQVLRRTAVLLSFASLFLKIPIIGITGLSSFENGGAWLSVFLITAQKIKFSVKYFLVNVSKFTMFYEFVRIY